MTAPRSLEDDLADARRDFAALHKRVGELSARVPVDLREDFALVRGHLNDADDLLASILTCAEDQRLGR